MPSEPQDRPNLAVMVVCTGNSCRSQMAEAFLRRAARGSFSACSAGSRPTGSVHPLALRVMAEAGFDLSEHRSKSIEEVLGNDEEPPVDVAITVCAEADRECPVLLGNMQKLHFGFEDPATAEGSEEEILETFRRIRDEIGRVFEAYAEGLRFGLERQGRRGR